VKKAEAWSWLHATLIVNCVWRTEMQEQVNVCGIM